MTIKSIDKIIKTLIFLAAFLLPLIMSPRNFDAFDLIKATTLYTLSALLLFFYFLKIFLSGKIKYYKSNFHLPLFVFFTVALISLIFSATPFASIYGEYGRYETIQTIFGYILLFFFAHQYLRDEKDQEKLLILIFVAYFFIILYGIAQGFRWDFLPDFMQRPELRSRSTLGNAVFFGGYLATTLPLLLNGIFFKENIFFKNLNFKFKIPHYLIISILVPAGIVASFFAESRGAWLGMAAGFLFLLAFRLKELRFNYNKLILLLVIGLMLSFTLLYFSSHGDVSSKIDYLSGRAKSMFILSGGSGATRIEIWKGCLKMIKDKPLTGFGLDHMLYWFPNYRTFRYANIEGEMTMPDRAHNEYLQMGVNMGVFGVFAFFWILSLWALTIIPRLKSKNLLFIGFVSGLVGYLVQAFFSISIIGLMSLFWIFISITSIKSREKITEYNFSLPQAVRVFFIFFFLILALIAITFS
ncbi:MAG: O-antigen ligase family protein, partial [Actinomycetia bacterium]|nr:O-antigen ligase family protein [Actinomycetes bacterium]